jgi:integrase
MASPKVARRRRRIGKVSLYLHHGGFWIYHVEAGRAVRRLVGDSAPLAECEASLLNARLVAAEAGISLTSVPASKQLAVLLGATTGVASNPTSTEGRSNVSAAELRSRFIEHHERVLASSMATVSRYRSATRYLEDFANESDDPMRVDVSAFTEHLRAIEVAPNGHTRAAKRRLRDKGILYILECARSMYRYGQQHALLSKAAPNPFAALGLCKLKIRNAKPIFVFTPEQELAFLNAADAWSFAVHFTLAKTGLRRGELVHLLIEDLDLEDGWCHVCSKPELGWTTKTHRDRRVPLVGELVQMLRRVTGKRKQGPVFLRASLKNPGTILTADRAGLAHAAEQRLDKERQRLGRSPSRLEEAKVHASVWYDAGAVDPDRVRTSFIRTAKAAGLSGASCVKSWRHTFATLLQQAGVDVLVRQQTLGHQAGNAESSALGMTGVYTHTTPEFQRQEIERAVRLRPQSLELVRHLISNSKGGCHDQ